jgi:hypothetical protein
MQVSFGCRVDLGFVRDPLIARFGEINSSGLRGPFLRLFITCCVVVLIVSKHIKTGGYFESALLKGFRMPVQRSPFGHWYGGVLTLGTRMHWATGCSSLVSLPLCARCPHFRRLRLWR